jgi:NAD(P)-dependent dehydrogenase (short-subunit alcohol dehydrogenase family)
MIQEVYNKVGVVDVLVNNAGVSSRYMVEDISIEEWRRVIDINLTGALIMCKAVMPNMMEQKYGRIISIPPWPQNGSAFTAVQAIRRKNWFAWPDRQLSFELGLMASPSTRYVRAPQ